MPGCLVPCPESTTAWPRRDGSVMSRVSTCALARSGRESGRLNRHNAVGYAVRQQHQRTAGAVRERLMSHSHRVLLLFPLLRCTCSRQDHTPSAADLSRELAPGRVHKTAKELRDNCKEYIASLDPSGHFHATDAENAVHVALCLGFIQGAVDGLALMPTPGVETTACVLNDPDATYDQTPPPEPTMEELVRVTLKFMDEHPEDLSLEAAKVVWRAMIASYPCSAK